MGPVRTGPGITPDGDTRSRAATPDAPSAGNGLQRFAEGSARAGRRPRSGAPTTETLAYKDNPAADPGGSAGGPEVYPAAHPAPEAMTALRGQPAAPQLPNRGLSLDGRRGPERAHPQGSERKAALAQSEASLSL